MKIIVLGSKGFIGSNLILTLKNKHNNYHFNNLLEITDLSTLFNIDINTLMNSIIVDCIGVKSHFFYQRSNPNYSQGNRSELLLRYQKLLDLAQKTQSKFFFICSGGSIYGKYRGNPWTELDDLNPVDNYGVANKIIEDMVMQSNGYSIRGSNIYGALKSNRQNQGIITMSLLSYLSSSTIKIYDRGLSVRDYLYIDDFIDCFINLIRNHTNIPKVINISSGEGINQLELIQTIDNILSNNNKRKLSELTLISDEKYNEIDKNILNPRLYNNLFNTTRRVSFESGLIKMMKKLEII